MDIYIGGRQSGKTERLVEWLAAGERTDHYPFWSRVVLCLSLDEAERLRKGVLAERFPNEDTYRWVFSLDEWQTARLGARKPEVAIDNADMVLQFFLGRVDAVTMTGNEWPGTPPSASTQASTEGSE